MNSPIEANQNFKRNNISFNESALVWLRIALLSFGGPVAQIGVMHRILVDEKKWVDENRFLHALNFCMLLPGPEAQQLATYIGWLLHRTRGGLVAGILFIIPGFISILFLSILYAVYQEQNFIQGFFFGIKAAVLAIVVEAIIRISKRALQNSCMYAIAIASFIAIFFFDVPFPWIIVGAGFTGFLGGGVYQEKFVVIKSYEPAAFRDDLAFINGGGRCVRRALMHSIKVLVIWATLWFVPVIALVYFLGFDNVFTQIGLFFSKLAVVTFGGAYAVLAYMAQEVVQNYGWLTAGEMLDGLGMAETTPGPLIQVTQFVAFMGAFRHPGILNPVFAGILASLLAVWTTFVPCFLWIFLGAPYVEQLRGIKSLSAALSSITAAVVGVVMNLAVWFGLHVFFGTVREFSAYGGRIFVPELSTVDFYSVMLAIFSFIALFRFKIGMIPVIGVTALLGVILYVLR